MSFNAYTLCVEPVHCVFRTRWSTGIDACLDDVPQDLLYKIAEHIEDAEDLHTAGRLTHMFCMPPVHYAGTDASANVAELVGCWMCNASQHALLSLNLNSGAVLHCVVNLGRSGCVDWAWQFTLAAAILAAALPDGPGKQNLWHV
eukprot:1159471-Pelagomonas_calceolata.AAC.9